MRRPTECPRRDRARGARPGFSAAMLILLAVTALLAAGCWLGTSGRAGSPGQSGRAGAPGRMPRFSRSAGLYLVMSQEIFDRIAAAAPQLAGRMLHGQVTLVLTGTTRPAPAAAIPTALFYSYAQFIDALRRHAIRPGVRVVAYDPELWGATPLTEQHDPRRYMSLFAATAHRHGYATILMPGRDMLLSRVTGCPDRAGLNLDAAFVRCDIAGLGAHLSGVFEIQTAPEEQDPAELRRFAAACERQARAADPAVVLLATLSTQLGSGQVSGAQLGRAADVLRPYVQGFQLNSRSWTTATAVAFLQALPELRG